MRHRRPSVSTRRRSMTLAATPVDVTDVTGGYRDTSRWRAMYLLQGPQRSPNEGHLA